MAQSDSQKKDQTGQTSEKRQHQPPIRMKASSQADAQGVTTAREASSGMATGRREAVSGMATGQASVQSPRDAATGIASGKRMHKPMMVADPAEAAAAQDVVTAREASSGMATGKTAAQSPMGTHHEAVIHRDLAAREASSDPAAAQADVQTARETGSGMATGRKTMAADDWNAQNKNGMSNAQSNPMYKDNTQSGNNPLYQGSSARATKTRSNIQNNRVAAGDVTGDGKADVSVQSGTPAQMKGDFSRGHQPDQKASSDASAGKGANDKKTAPRDAATGQASGKRQH
jgi:hypothetical protein